MRFAPVLVLLALGCGNKSKLDADRSSAVDALWELAPDGTELGIVASPRAVELAVRGIAAVRKLADLPDLAPAKPQIDALMTGMFGSPTATPADAGFASDKGFAMFATSEQSGGGVIGIMPVADRDKFMASKNGKRGATEDTLEGNTCRPMRGLYICATKPEMFDRIGKGNLRGKLKEVGARGDAELLFVGMQLLGETKGDLLVAAALEPGQVSVNGRWLGTPSGLLAKVIGMRAPNANATGASGFVSVDVASLIADLPPLPIAGGVTIEQLAKSLKGPVSAVIPAGSVDIQITAPLVDPAPAATVIANCPDVAQFFELSKTQTPGACRLVLQGTNALELDAWVEGDVLRLGGKKGPPPAGNPAGMTAIGRELSSGNWTAALWGRGTMLNLSGIAPATTELPVQVALGIHAMALVNELGAAAKVDKDGVRFRGFLRTAWSNPPQVVAKISAITGNEIVSGKATEPAKAIATAHPNSPFAADFAAGQGGLMVPAAAIGIASAVVIPAVMRAIGGGGGTAVEEEESPHGPPMGDAELASLLVRAYAEEAFPKWQAEHKSKDCPATLDELAKYFGENPGIPVMTDPWGHALVMKCGKDLPAGATGIAVFSMGADGKPGTDDDVKSW